MKRGFVWVSLPDVDVLDAYGFDPTSLSLKLSTKYGRSFGLPDCQGGHVFYFRRFQDSSRRVPSLGHMQFSLVPLFGAAVRRWDFQLQSL